MNHIAQTAIVAAMIAGFWCAAAVAQTISPAPFTQAQADAGRQSYMANCASCHGDSLAGIGAPALTGKEFATSSIGQLSAAQLYGYIQGEMPFGASGSLSSDTYVSILAFILEANGAKPGSRPLTPDSGVKVGDIITGEMPAGFLRTSQSN